MTKSSPFTAVQRAGLKEVFKNNDGRIIREQATVLAENLQITSKQVKNISDCSPKHSPEMVDLSTLIFLLKILIDYIQIFLWAS